MKSNRITYSKIKIYFLTVQKINSNYMNIQEIYEMPEFKQLCQKEKINAQDIVILNFYNQTTTYHVEFKIIEKKKEENECQKKINQFNA